MCLIASNWWLAMIMICREDIRCFSLSKNSKKSIIGVVILVILTKMSGLWEEFEEQSNSSEELNDLSGYDSI